VNGGLVVLVADTDIGEVVRFEWLAF